MIDHVTIRVPNLGEAERFYSRALALLGFEDQSTAKATDERPSTRHLHIGFQADSPATVDTWWQAIADAGYPDDESPGPRPKYGPEYYGAFVTDPAENSIEAVHHGPPRHNGVINHLWLRVRSLANSTRFYDAITPTVGYTTKKLADGTMIHGDGASFSLVEGRPTENVHLAFTAAEQTEV